MELRFTGPIFFWRGPAPFHFVSVPEAESAALADVSPLVSYGWGMIPATVRIGGTTATTALWPKDGGYIVPVKRVFQDAEQVSVGDTVTIVLTVDVRT
ncbi:DUF1905 domain-containing protein [Frondihabitans cladoniiphilus]|uniref:DUF1905 domain-containing protein n=1 Tax=Frondihabitans cladoniiphilus TaxID=715785 RepID=A0ABP8W497_9MICO